VTDSLFSGSPGVSDAADGQPINTATTFYVTAPVTCSHHRFFASTVSYVANEPTAWLYQLTGDGAGTLLAEKAYAAVNVGAYNSVAWDTPISLTTGVYYRIGHYSPNGHYVATLGALNVDATSGGGLLVAPANGTVTGIGTLGNGKFKYGAEALADQTSAGTNFFDDVIVSSSAVTREITAAATIGGVSGDATAVREASLLASASLGGVAGAAAVFGDTVPDHGTTSGGSWYGLLAVVQETRELARQERARPRVACVCGEPLRSGPRGELYCAFDGRKYS
jgi:hypothetical protein